MTPHLTDSHHPRMNHAIRARPFSIGPLPIIWRRFSPRLMPILMRKAYLPMCSVNRTSTYNAVSGPWLSAAGLRHLYKELLLAFSCKRRGFCPSCAGRRMARDRGPPGRAGPSRGPHPPMGRVGPIPLRYWMAASQELTAKVHTIIRTTIGQDHVNQGGRTRGPTGSGATGIGQHEATPSERAHC